VQLFGVDLHGPLHRRATLLGPQALENAQTELVRRQRFAG
jgi:hypothetical protein